ncbi:MAG TPA: 16S rRNA (cytosine(967)-C(5))-methyltransferase RsmB [Actinomycetota bacterium]|nr:16S rRNA (cytosine(967)-C(5))-methyltransferase RsmB [Actinomycetota bacterium]
MSDARGREQRPANRRGRPGGGTPRGRKPAPKPRARPAPTDSRAVAFGVIRRVTEEGAFSTLAMASALDRSHLEGRDRALATELGYGTLRRLRSLDWALGPRVNRPLERVTPRALALLRLGAYQVLFTRIPPHAAVGETVAMAREGERGFVNAVLRSLAATPPRWPAGGAPDAVAIRTGIAPWAVAELERVLPEDQLAPAAEALAAHAPLSIRTNTCRVESERLLAAVREAGHRARHGAIHSDTLLVDEASPSRLPGFRDGWFAIQDESSAFVVQALDPRPGDRVLDACAGPGGKATHAACLVGDDGLLVAADASPARAGLVAQLAGKLGVPVRVVTQDARRPAVNAPFDRILVDAPCSGIGAARRRPELLWRPARDDLSRLARLQVAIASSAAALLKPGGRLVYSVCTFPRAETDAACRAILRHRPELRPAEIEGPDGPAERVRLWPHLHGTDAMFVAAFTSAG